MILMFLACSQNKISDTAEERDADFSIQVGVESVSVVDAQPNTPLTLYNQGEEALVTLISDEYGQAHFAYIPEEYQVLNPANFEGVSLENGNVLPAGDGYFIRDDQSEGLPWSGTFRVLAIDDYPENTFYEEQELRGIHFSPLTGASSDVEEGYQYIIMRDGVGLSAMIRFPDPLLYGEGPYPTVIEYSGYSPSRPDRSPEISTCRQSRSLLPTASSPCPFWHPRPDRDWPRSQSSVLHCQPFLSATHNVCGSCC